MLDEYFELFKSARTLPKEKSEGFRKMLNYLLMRSDADNFNWAARQAYIALGFGLVAAAAENVDSVPIEGFNSKELDSILELEDKNLGTVCLLALGNRDEEKDYNANLPKVRKSKEKLFVEI